MKASNKTGSFFTWVVRILFAALMCCIVYATVVLDKSVNSPFPNTVVFANGVYYLFAFVLMCILYRFCRRAPAMKLHASADANTEMNERVLYHACNHCDHYRRIAVFCRAMDDLISSETEGILNTSQTLPGN